VATNATTTNATSTNFFATTASSTNLFSTNANTGVLSLGSLNLSSPLTVSSGGTGWASFATGLIPFGNGSSALATSSSLFWDNTNSRLGVSTTTPGSLLSVGTTNGINFSTATSTFSSTGGINIASGCYAVNGTCLPTSTGAPSQLVSTYTLDPSSNAVSVGDIV